MQKSTAIVGVLLAAMALTVAAAGEPQPEKAGKKPPGPISWPMVDTTLEYYLSRSDTVVQGTLTKVQDREQALMDAAGLVHYECDVVVSSVIKGKLKPNETLRILVPRWRNSPGPTAGKRYILFLNEREAAQPQARTTLADLWFGIQPDDELMAARLRVLVANAKK